MTDAPRNPNEVVFTNPDDGYQLTRGEIAKELGEILDHVIEHLLDATKAWAEDPDPNVVGPMVGAATGHMITALLPGLSNLAQHDSEQAKIQEAVNRYAASVHADIPDFVPPDWE